MTTMKRYPGYKDSGIEWLGEIPKHWRIKRLKHICTRSALYGANESSGQYADEGVRFLRTSDINDSGTLINDASVFISPSVVKDYILQDGDILFSRSGTIGRSFLYKNDLHGECAYAGYLVRFCLDSKRVNPKFVFQFTKSRQFNDWLMSIMIESTIGNVNGQKYAGMPLAIPDIAEQQAIAEYLDRQTAKIDVLIAKKERQVELLKEKRTAIISHAVARGLNSDVPMKDSGIEWLGEIPGHWEVKRLKYSAKMIMGQSPNSDDYSTDSDLMPFLQGNADFSERYPSPRIYCDSANKIVPKGSLLISVRAAVGALNEADKEYGIGRGLCAIIPGKYLLKNFAWYALQTTREELNTLATGSTYDAVSANEVGNMLFPLTTLTEQGVVADYLDRQTAKIDALTARIQLWIDKLKEYRTALISAAVTGKIDVRGEA
jgi:type I restriction enzyme S subunit